MPAGRWERLRAKKRPDEPKSKGAPKDNGGDDDGTVHLDDAVHDWWAKSDAQTTYVPRPDQPPPPKKEEKKPPPAADTHKRDTFTDYFSTESLFIHNQWPTAEDAGPAPEDTIGPFSADDPYVVLGIPSSATWDDITVAHRRLAKLHHPDHLLNATDDDRYRSEQRMRDINIAYSELRRRRGK